MRSERGHLENGDLPSGPWRCRWVQEGRSELEELSLDFHGGQVRGSGSDADGVFAYRGTVYAEGSVSLVKVYVLSNIVVPLSISYIGQWDGRCCNGQWIDDGEPSNNGPFRLWPGTCPEPASEPSESIERPAPSPASGLVPILVRKERPKGGEHGR